MEFGHTVHYVKFQHQITTMRTNLGIQWFDIFFDHYISTFLNHVFAGGRKLQKFPIRNHTRVFSGITHCSYLHSKFDGIHSTSGFFSITFVAINNSTGRTPIHWAFIERLFSHLITSVFVSTLSE